MIKFKLDDIKSYKLEFGDKFYLPERKKRQNLRAGELICDDEIQFQRMWIVINGANNGKCAKILDNKPLTKNAQRWL